MPSEPRRTVQDTKPQQGSPDEPVHRSTDIGSEVESRRILDASSDELLWTPAIEGVRDVRWDSSYHIF
jgi:hypothetical protein